jgi:LysR family transcriptional regulator, hydrogen peroxide-inducible genes activator
MRWHPLHVWHEQSVVFWRSSVPTLRQLDYLVAIADTRHFRRAAGKVNTTQSTLSSQLKALEERLGMELVERSSTRVVVTPCGEEIVAIARRMLRDAQTIREIAKTRMNGLSGVMRAGVPPTIGPSLLPKVIPLLRLKFPQLKIYVREEKPSDLVIALENGGYDVIITVLPVASAALVSVPLFEDPLLLAIASDHPLASKPSLMSADLADQDILTLTKGHHLHSVVETLCQRTGATLRDDYQGTSLDTLREMVASGLGVAVLPMIYTRNRLVSDPSIVLRELADYPLVRTIGMCWRQSTPQGDRFQSIANVVMSSVSKEWAELQPAEVPRSSRTPKNGVDAISSL